MRFNSKKCVFEVEWGEFLGFILTHRGIDANPNKCQTIMIMWNSRNLKEIQILIDHLTSLSHFLLRLTEKINPILKLIKKVKRFDWYNTCEEAFSKIKTSISSPSTLNNFCWDNNYEYMYLWEEMVSIALMQGK